MLPNCSFSSEPVLWRPACEKNTALASELLSSLLGFVSTLKLDCSEVTKSVWCPLLVFETGLLSVFLCSFSCAVACFCLDDSIYSLTAEKSSVADVILKIELLCNHGP